MQYINTFRQILREPSDVIDGFVLEHKESRSMHPFSFGLIGVILIVSLYSVTLGLRTPVVADLVSQNIGPYQQLTYWIQYADLKLSTLLLPLLMFLLLIPSLAIPGLFFFRENIDGFYYNLILSTYAVGAGILALIVMIPFWLLYPSTLFNTTITTYLPLGIVGIVILRIYENYFAIEGISSWVRLFSTYICGCLLFLMLESFSISVLGYFIFAVNRFVEIWMTI